MIDQQSENNMGCYNSTVVNASVDDVWTALRNFHDLSWSAHVVETVDIIGDRAGDQIGAKRVLNNAFHETLQCLDDSARVIKYTIDDGPAAVAKDNVSGYVGQVRVSPITADNTTFVEWSSSWQSSGGGVADFCSPIYRGLLNDLKEHFA